MQEFRNLWADCDEAKAKRIYEKISEMLAESSMRWRVDDTRKEYYARLNPMSANRILFIRGERLDDCCISSGLEVSVCLCFLERCSCANGESAIQVTNIVPTAGRNELLMAEYNCILEVFRKEVIDGIGKIEGVVWQLSFGMSSYRDFMPESSMEAFRTFVQTANKSCAASHPSDRRAWNDFVIKYADSTVPPKRGLTADVLQQLLVEDYKWEKDSAFKLGCDFEFGVGLLRQYNGQ